MNGRLFAGGASWERGRPARKWAAGPQVFKRAGRPRSQGPLRSAVETPGAVASPGRLFTGGAS